MSVHFLSREIQLIFVYKENVTKANCFGIKFKLDSSPKKLLQQNKSLILLLLLS